MLPVETSAGGKAIFQVSKGDKNEISFTLTVKEIENVTGAHIHRGKEGKNGPAVIDLFTGRAEGLVNGLLSMGILQADRLVNAPREDDLTLIQMIEVGDAYVNVSTDKHPDGEIRGQIK